MLPSASPDVMWAWTAARFRVSVIRVATSWKVSDAEAPGRALSSRLGAQPPAYGTDWLTHQCLFLPGGFAYARSAKGASRSTVLSFHGTFECGEMRGWRGE